MARRDDVSSSYSSDDSESTNFSQEGSSFCSTGSSTESTADRGWHSLDILKRTPVSQSPRDDDGDEKEVREQQQMNLFDPKQLGLPTNTVDTAVSGSPDPSSSNSSVAEDDFEEHLARIKEREEKALLEIQPKRNSNTYQADATDSECSDLVDQHSTSSHVGDRSEADVSSGASSSSSSCYEESSDEEEETSSAIEDLSVEEEGNSSGASSCFESDDAEEDSESNRDDFEQVVAAVELAPTIQLDRIRDQTLVFDDETSTKSVPATESGDARNAAVCNITTIEADSVSSVVSVSEPGDFELLVGQAPNVVDISKQLPSAPDSPIANTDPATKLFYPFDSPKHDKEEPSDPSSSESQSGEGSDDAMEEEFQVEIDSISNRGKFAAQIVPKIIGSWELDGECSDHDDCIATKPIRHDPLKANNALESTHIAVPFESSIDSGCALSIENSANDSFDEKIEKESSDDAPSIDLLGKDKRLVNRNEAIDVNPGNTKTTCVKENAGSQGDANSLVGMPTGTMTRTKCQGASVSESKDLYESEMGKMAEKENRLIRMQQEVSVLEVVQSSSNEESYAEKSQVPYVTAEIFDPRQFSSVLTDAVDTTISSGEYDDTDEDAISAYGPRQQCSETAKSTSINDQNTSSHSQNKSEEGAEKKEKPRSRHRCGAEHKQPREPVSGTKDRGSNSEIKEQKLTEVCLHQETKTPEQKSIRREACGTKAESTRRTDSEAPGSIEQALDTKPPKKLVLEKKESGDEKTSISITDKKILDGKQSLVAKSELVERNQTAEGRVGGDQPSIVAVETLPTEVVVDQTNQQEMAGEPQLDAACNVANDNGPPTGKTIVLKKSQQSKAMQLSIVPSIDVDVNSSKPKEEKVSSVDSSSTLGSDVPRTGQKDEVDDESHSESSVFKTCRVENCLDKTSIDEPKGETKPGDTLSPPTALNSKAESAGSEIISVTVENDDREVKRMSGSFETQSDEQESESCITLAKTPRDTTNSANDSKSEATESGGVYNVVREIAVAADTEEDKDVQLAMVMAMAAMQNPSLSPAELQELVFGENEQARLVAEATKQRRSRMAKEREDASNRRRAHRGGWFAAIKQRADRHYYYADLINKDSEIVKLKEMIVATKNTLKAYRNQGYRFKSKHISEKKLILAEFRTTCTNLESTMRAVSASDHDLAVFEKALERAGKKLKKQSSKDSEELVVEAKLCQNMLQMLAIEKQKSMAKKDGKETKAYLDKCSSGLSTYNDLCSTKLATIDAMQESLIALLEDTVSQQDALIAKLSNLDGCNDKAGRPGNGTKTERETFLFSQ